MTVGDSAVHSAPQRGETPAEEAHRPHLPAPAREGSGQSAQSQPNSAVTPSDENRGLWAWLRATFTPPDIWSTDRPSLKKRWAYATDGEWTTDIGLVRRAGQAYTVIAIVVATVLNYLDWIIERPSRLAAAAVLVWLLAQFPPLSWLI